MTTSLPSFMAYKHCSPDLKLDRLMLLRRVCCPQHRHTKSATTHMANGDLFVLCLGTPHETEIYVRLQRVDVMFSIV
jgi:hypothetical protein